MLPEPATSPSPTDVAAEPLEIGEAKVELALEPHAEAVLARISREWHLPGAGPLEQLRIHLTRALEAAAELAGEPDVRTLIRRRIVAGRAVYGPLDLAAPRPWLVEALHELTDALFYVACEAEAHTPAQSLACWAERIVSRHGNRHAAESARMRRAVADDMAPNEGSLGERLRAEAIALEEAVTTREKPAAGSAGEEAGAR